MTDKECIYSLEGAVVVECARALSLQQYDAIKARVEAAFPDKRVLVLSDGLKLHVAQHEAIARVEAKLGLLLEMLAEDAQGEPQAFDLSGHPLPRERNENDTL